MKSFGSFVCSGLALAASMMLFDASAKCAESVLYSFMGAKDGGIPTGILAADGAGNLYGVTGEGGTKRCSSSVNNATGCGTVFEVTASGKETVLHAFTGGSGGASPVGGVIRDASGNLYGATGQGGLTEAHCGHGCGTVFKLTAAGKLKILYAFTGGSDGQGPSDGLLADGAKNLYGMTITGGISGNCGDRGTPGCGVIFKLASNGTETILHTFTGGSGDGGYPLGSLIADSSGNLYGTTVVGGGTDGCGILLGQGCGIVFKLATDGTLSILHAFTGGSDGSYPTGALLFDATGNLYGTTVGGGSMVNCGIGPYGCGTVFKIASNGTETLLYIFKGGRDGGYPTSGVIAGKAGIFYGVTGAGGSKSKCGLRFNPIGCGVIFELTTGGSEQVLHTFTGKKGDGGYPLFGIIRNATGDIFSATSAGGIAGCSTGAGTLDCGTVVERTQ